MVDSRGLSLNVNRESLQESKILKVIKKKVVRKAIDMIKSFAEKNDSIEEEVEVDEEGNVVESDSKETESPYLKWYKKFSPNLKLGVMEDEPNRAKLTKLLRFQTSKSGESYVSLDTYLENMKEWQDEIYVLGGASVEELESSPYLEIAREKDVEVLYLTDAVDEYMVKQVMDYKDKKFVHISSESVKFKDEDADLVKRREKAYKKKFDPFTGCEKAKCRIAARGDTIDQTGTPPIFSNVASHADLRLFETIRRHLNLGSLFQGDCVGAFLNASFGKQLV